MPHAGTNPFWGPDWADIRALWPLDPKVAHLNHGSFGAVPTPVQRRQAEYRERAAANPMRFFKRELPAERERARRAVAAFLGADPDGLAFVPNATTGISGVLRSLPLTSGDEVVITDHCYGAIQLAVAATVRYAKARLITVRIPLDATPPDIVARVSAAVTARTALVLIDHVTSSTARLFPVAEVVRAIHDRSVPVLVDGAHAPGMLSVDLEGLAPDFWVGNLHKWVCAPQGAGVLYAGEARRRGMRSVVVSWGEQMGFPLSYGEIGTTDQSAWLAAPAAVDLLGSLGWDRVRRHNADLVRYGQRLIAGALGVDLSAQHADPGLSMRIIPLPSGVGADEAAADDLITMIADGLAVEVAATAWRGQGLLRLSAQVYNRPADYAALADGLPALLDQVVP